MSVVLRRKVSGEVVRVEETPLMVKKVRKKKSERTKRQELCDTLFSEAVRMRDHFTCCYCGAPTKMAEAHHIFTRINLSTRYDLDNGVTLCYYHHRFGAHGGAAFTVWVQRKWLGQSAFDALERRTHETVKGTDAWYDEQERRLRDYIAKLQGKNDQRIDD